MIKRFKILCIVLVLILFAGCVDNSNSEGYYNTGVVTKDIRVINNVPSEWGSSCSCSILADDGIVYTATKESCVKLPIGMNATITSDLGVARYTGYKCAIYDVRIHP